MLLLSVRPRTCSDCGGGFSTQRECGFRSRPNLTNQTQIPFQHTYLQTFGGLQERGQTALADVHLALVHKVEQRTHLSVFDIFQIDDRVRMVILQEYRLEVRTARGQNRLVGLLVAGGEL